MTQRRIWLCDHRGRNAIVVLVSRRHAAPLGHRDAAGAPVRFSRHIKSTADTNFDSLSRQHGEPEALAQALVAGDPDLDIEAAGRETGACDRVYVGHDGKPLYSATMLEVICDRDGNEIQRRPPEMIPANLVPDSAPVWSGKLLSYREAISRFAFTRAYQVRHGNALEYDFLYGLAAHLEQGQSLVLVGSGPRGIGPLIPGAQRAPHEGLPRRENAAATPTGSCSTSPPSSCGNRRAKT